MTATENDASSFHAKYHQPATSVVVTSIDSSEIMFKQRNNQTSTPIQLVFNKSDNNNEFIAGKMMIGIGLLIFALFF